VTAEAVENPIPAAPRPSSDLISRRAWTEPRVRFWLFLTAFLLITALALAGQAIAEWRHDDQLIKYGIAIMAEVKQAGQMKLPFKHPQPPDTIVVLHYTVNGVEHDTRPDKLSGRKVGEFITPGDHIPIRVSATNPDDWTPRTEPVPLIERSMGVDVTLPMAILSGALAFILSRRLAGAWRNGKAIEALVVETRVAGAAPRCRAVRVTPAAEGDSKIYTVYVPPRLSRLKRGESIMILVRRTGLSTAVAAAWFQES
jgi:hypothetical protein